MEMSAFSPVSWEVMCRLEMKDFGDDCVPYIPSPPHFSHDVCAKVRSLLSDNDKNTSVQSPSPSYTVGSGIPASAKASFLSQQVPQVPQ